MNMRTRIQTVLAEADKIDETWARANDDENGAPSAKQWQDDDDARRALSYDAVAILRDLLILTDKGEDLDLAVPAQEMLFMEWCSEEEFEDADLLLAPHEIYTVCPKCHVVNGGIFEIDTCERWNRSELDTQSDKVGRYGPRNGQWVHLGEVPNPLAGLPLLAIIQGDGDFHTTGYACGACEAEVTLPEWVESEW